MAMFDDPKKELKKLEQQLLQDEEWLDRELAAARALMGEEPAPKAKSAQTRKKPPQANPARTGGQEAPVRNYANNYGKNTRTAPETKRRKKGVKGLVILAVLETLGIVAIVAYWLQFLL